MRQLVYDRAKSDRKMNIVCFISGSGTNYREIVARDHNQNYLVFTNRPGCAGAAIARENRHELIEFSHIPFLKEARKKYGPGNIPRNCPERLAYEQEVVKLIEGHLGKQPDLICLAGYDQWNTDWLVERYYPRILNVHPGDTTRGYVGLHWIPAAEAIIAGDVELRSTLFFVDKSVDNGPVLLQSKPLSIMRTLAESVTKGAVGLLTGLEKVAGFVREQGITTYAGFKEKAGPELLSLIEQICTNLQDALKIAGDWKIYPFAVHDLIAKGRVE
jgi:phosphoribosylglycinamide formyltransferase-1